nr:hypothetical protein [Tanacetum cinerariifolium]
MQEIYTSARSRTASVPVAFDFKRCRHEIARMILLHDYPLHMVEHKGFMTYKFNMDGFNTVQGDCVATYLSERSTIENLNARMPGRICLTLDVWNSNITTGYVFITGQFIDSDWNIHKRLPSVVMELVAHETLQVCQKMVKKVTDCVKYVKASKALEEYFPDLKQLQVLNIRNLSLDDQTKLNTTFEILLAASALKKEFSRLDTLYPDYFKSPSANTFFDEAWKIQLELTHASTTVVMDLRFKMQLVDFSFAKIFGDEAASYINIVDEGIHQLFLDYVTGDVTGHLSNEDGHGLGLTDFNDFIMESKLNEPKYPTLSKMAHDILTLHVSTVDPESVFDTGVKEIGRYRWTLKPKTVEQKTKGIEFIEGQPGIESINLTGFLMHGQCLQMECGNKDWVIKTNGDVTGSNLEQKTTKARQCYSRKKDD